MSSTAMRVIRRKKSSLSEVKIAVIGAPAVGKSDFGRIPCQLLLVLAQVLDGRNALEALRARNFIRHLSSIPFTLHFDVIFYIACMKQDVRIRALWNETQQAHLSLTVRYLTKRYIGEYDHNSENRYKHEAMLDGEPVIFEILDTCPKSCDDFPSPDTIQWADGFLLVYSILDRSSFDYIIRIRRYITEQKPGGNGLSMVLLANKADMVHLRQVVAEEGEQLGKDLDCYFAEVAAAEQMQSIADAFAELGREVHAARRRSKPPMSHSLLDRVLGNRASASIGIRTYVRGKSDSALPKD